MAALDISKAFDKVYQDIVFFKLLDDNVPVLCVLVWYVQCCRQMTEQFVTQVHDKCWSISKCALSVTILRHISGAQSPARGPHTGRTITNHTSYREQQSGTPGMHC